MTKPGIPKNKGFWRKNTFRKEKKSCKPERRKLWVSTYLYGTSLATNNSPKPQENNKTTSKCIKTDQKYPQLKDSWSDNIFENK